MKRIFNSNSDGNQDKNATCCVFKDKVGSTKIFNKLTDIKNMDPPKKKKKQKLFCLGYGKNILNDETEAAAAYFKRDFAEKFEDGKPIFIPSSFIDKMAGKLLTERDGRPKLNNEQQRELEKYKNNLDGSAQEKLLFGALNNISIYLKKCVIINGWHDNGGENRPNREYDFLIVSKEKHEIFHIEVKKSQSSNNIKKAAEQLTSGFQFFKDSIPFPKSEKWHYTQAMCFNNENEDEMPCEKCQRYVLYTSRNLEGALKTLFKSSTSHDKPTDRFETVVKFLLHRMHWQGDVINESQLFHHTSRVIGAASKPETILFWTQEQFNLMKDPKYKRVAFTSTFGTGKTILLKSKARELLEAEEKVVFVIFADSKKDSLLKKTCEQEFQSFKTITLLHFISSDDATNEEELAKLALNHSDSNFFIDEYDNHSIKEKTLEKLFSENFFFWIAYKSQSNSNKDVLKKAGFHLPEMILPLRYTGKILSTSKAYNSNSNSWPPDQIVPEHFLNEGVKTIILESTNETPIVFQVIKVSEILSKMVEKTIIKTNFEEVTIKRELLKLPIGKRIVFENQIDEFIESKDKILMLSKASDKLLRGFEVPLLVVFSNESNSAELNEEIFTRCNNLLVLVYEGDITKTKFREKNGRCLEITPVEVDMMPDLSTTDQSDWLNYWTSRRPLPIDIKFRNETEKTILMLACANDDEKMVKDIFNEDIVKQPPDVNLSDNEGMTALHIASQRGNINIVRLLISNRARLDSLTKKNETALHMAVMNKHVEIAKLLLKYSDCSVNQKCQIIAGKITKTNTVLHLATENGDKRLVKMILDYRYGLDINIKDEENRTAIDIARKKVNEEIVGILNEYTRDHEAAMKNNLISVSRMRYEILIFVLVIVNFLNSIISGENTSICFFIWLIPFLYSLLNKMDNINLSFFHFLISSIKKESASLTDPKVKFLMDVNFSYWSLGFPLGLIIFFEKEHTMSFSWYLYIFASFMYIIYCQNTEKEKTLFLINSVLFFIYRIIIFLAFSNFLKSNFIIFLIIIILLNILIEISSHNETIKNKISLAILSLFYPINYLPITNKNQLFSVRSASIKNIAMNVILCFAYIFLVEKYKLSSTNSGTTTILFQMVYPDQWVAASQFYASILMGLATVPDIWINIANADSRQFQDTETAMRSTQQQRGNCQPIQRLNHGHQ